MYLHKCSGFTLVRVVGTLTLRVLKIMVRCSGESYVFGSPLLISVDGQAGMPKHGQFASTALGRASGRQTRGVTDRKLERRQAQPSKMQSRRSRRKVGKTRGKTCRWTPELGKLVWHGCSLSIVYNTFRHRVQKTQLAIRHFHVAHSISSRKIPGNVPSGRSFILTKVYRNPPTWM